MRCREKLYFIPKAIFIVFLKICFCVFPAALLKPLYVHIWKICNCRSLLNAKGLALAWTQCRSNWVSASSFQKIAKFLLVLLKWRDSVLSGLSSYFGLLNLIITPLYGSILSSSTVLIVLHIFSFDSHNYSNINTIRIILQIILSSMPLCFLRGQTPLSSTHYLA